QRGLSSFPTRRSSDLVGGGGAALLAAWKPEGWQAMTIALIGLATAVAWAVALWQKPSLKSVALRLDEAAQTRDRISTAFTFEERSEEHTSELQSRENL